VDLWNEVDARLEEKLVPPDKVLASTLAAADEAGLPPIQVSPTQGKLLYILARMMGARRILEIGTLAGYSTIWLGRALSEDGSLVTLEIDPAHAEVARSNLAAAGLAELVDIRVGPALDTLAELEETFDLVFIDADKVGTPEYMRWALNLSRPGAVVVVDNLVREGAILAADNSDAAAMKEVVELVASDPRLDATAIQTVGTKGHDGFLIAIVGEPEEDR
jgi:predicted O-methyltransferase YrrM